jgi:hypothetical protein
MYARFIKSWELKDRACEVWLQAWGSSLRGVVTSLGVRKQLPEPPFIAHRGGGLIIYSIIVLKLYYKVLSHLAELSSSFWDLGSCRYVVARHIALGWACLSVVTSLICCLESHVSGQSLLSNLILDHTTCS